MDIKPDNVSAIRVYAFDYIVGVLWLAAFIVISMTDGPSQGVIAAARAWNDAVATLKAPDFVIGFLLALGGVALPYCIAVILKPATLYIMGVLQRRQRDLRRLLAKRVSQDWSDDDRPLEQVAKESVHAALRCRRSDVNLTEVLLTYVQCRNETVAPAIIASRDEVYFRAMAVLPSALLCSSLVAILPVISVLVVSGVTFLAVLLFGAWMANRVFDSWIQTVYVAIVLESDPIRRPPPTPALHQTAGPT